MRFRDACWLCLLALITACGGGGGDQAAPTGPVVPVPASVAIAAGDAQRALPGQGVAVSPSVVVRDQQGRAMSSVSVVFVVTSGGGAVANSTTTTDAAGVASAGRWTLGPSGDQLLEARVAALPAAVIRASLVAVQIDATVGTGGGVIEVVEPAHPLVGTRLTIPSGTFATSGVWRITPDSAPTILPSGFTAVGRAMRIETDQRRGARLMTLRVPIAQRAGAVSVLIATDATGSRFELMPIIARDSTSITVGVTHFTSALLSGRAPSSGLATLWSATGSSASPHTTSRSSLGSLDMMWIVGGSYMLPQLGLPTDLPALIASQIGAPDAGSVLFPNGHGPALPLLNIIGRAQNRSFGTSVGVLTPFNSLADTAAFAAMALIARQYEQSLPSTKSVLQDLVAAWDRLLPAQRDELTVLNMRAGLLASRLPQLLFFGERLSLNGDFGKTAFADVIGISTQGFWFTQPPAPRSPFDLQLTGTGFVSRAIRRVLDGSPFQAQAILPLGGSFLFPLENYADIVTQLSNALGASGALRATANQLMFAAAGIPETVVELRSTTSAPWRAVFDTIFLRDNTAQLRVTCALCPQAFQPGEDPTQQSFGLGQRLTTAPFRAGAATTLSAQSIDLLDRYVGSGQLHAANMLDALGIGTLTATIFATMDGAVADLPGQIQRAVISTRLPVVEAIFKIATSATTVPKDSLIDFSARVEHAPANGWVVDWEWNDGSTVERTTNVHAASHRFRAKGTTKVRATLRSVASTFIPSIPLAVAEYTIEVIDPRPYWRLDTFSGVANFSPFSNPQNTAVWNGVKPMLDRLLAEPRAGLIAVDSSATLKRLVLRVKGTGTFSTACCAPAPDASEWILQLGRQPAEPNPFDGQFLIWWPMTQWTQSTASLGSGSMTWASYDQSTVFTYGVPNTPTRGPLSLWDGTATRTDRTLSGTLTYGLMMRDAAQHWQGVANITFTFTATRLQ